MPLIKSGSREAVHKNISEMVRAGYPQKQAVAAALATARKYGKKYAEGGPAEEDEKQTPPKLSKEKSRLKNKSLAEDIEPIEGFPEELTRDTAQDSSTEESSEMREANLANQAISKDEDDISLALNNEEAMPEHKAGGGGVNDWMMHQASKNLHYEGMIKSPIPGRTDKIPMSVKAGSYIIPADIPSALGQGNSVAGGNILSKMFNSGPYGMATPRIHSGRGYPKGMSLRPQRIPRGTFAEGGDIEGGEEEHSPTPIIAAGGEYVIPPEVVKALGNGDIGKGHRLLDAFVLHTRREHIKTLKKLKPPKK